MTVCLLVFARHVPQLESVRVLLSDEPAMEPKVSYYERLLAMDTNEAAAVFRAYVSRHSREQAYDEILLPSLSYAKADLAGHKISAREYDSVVSGSRKIVEDGDAAFQDADHLVSGTARVPFTGSAEAAHRDRGSDKIRMLSCPAQDRADEVALLMLRQLLNPSRYELEIMPAGTLASEIAALVDEKKPPLVCIAAVSPGGLDQLRYLCKRLRAVSAEFKIVVACWGAEEIDAVRESLMLAGADEVGSTLRQTRDQIASLRPLIAPSRESMVSAPPVSNLN
jgi:hypothetical protein